MVRLATGVQGFDAMVQGGLPEGSSVVLQGPPGQEKLRFALTFLAEGLKKGASGLVMTASQSPNAVLAELRSLGVDLEGVTRDSRLRIVDWYSWSEEMVRGVEEHGLILRSSIDLTDLGNALGRAAASLSGDQPRRAVIELLSPAMNAYELSQVYGFAQSAKKKLDRFRFTSLVLLEKDMHTGPESTTLHQPFDGVIEIERTRSGDQIIRKIGVLHLKDTAPDPTFRTLEMTRAVMRVVREAPKAPVPPGPAAQKGALFESQEERARRLTLIMQIARERLKLDPKDADALFAMAAAQATLDDARGGLQSLERLSELDPNYPGLWVLKTKLHARLGETDRARQSRQRALESDARATSTTETVPCPMCEAPVALDATICRNCGIKFAPPPKLEDELEDLGHAAIQEIVQEDLKDIVPGPGKAEEPRRPRAEPDLPPAGKPTPVPPPKPPLKPIPKKGLTNGLVLARGAGRKTGRTNGLRGRTNGLRGRTNGLTNGLRGRTNGLTNGVGRTNGLTNGLGRTNGLTNGLGRTNGLTNGLGRTNGITNGLGRTNGLTNGLGGQRSVTFRSAGFRGMMRTAGWKLYIIPLVVAGLLLMPLFLVPDYNGPLSPIRIDGQFGDWATVSTMAMGPGGTNPNVDIVSFGMIENLGPYAFYVRVAGSALQGGGAPPGTMDSVRILVDTDGSATTGYLIDGIGADRLIEVSGYAGTVRTSTLWEFDSNRDVRDWHGWIKGTATPAAISGSQIEAEAEWIRSESSAPAVVATVHTASWDASSDVGEFPLSPGQSSLTAVAVSEVPVIIAGSGVPLLRLSLTGHGSTVSVDSLTVQIIGTTSVTASSSLRLMDGPTVLAQVVPTARDVTFSFPAIAIPDGSTVTLSVVGDFTGTGGDTFGVRLPTLHPFGVASAAVGLREGPGAQTVGYLGSVPASPEVDGGFAEWASASVDAVGDVGPAANPDIDLVGHGAIAGPSLSHLYADVTGRILRGTPVPEVPRPTPVGGPPAPADSDRDTVPDGSDSLPLDFNNDGVPDGSTNGDYDGDLILDYGFAGGTDTWLNTTLPGTFPPPYGGRPVSVYIGPTEEPPALGEDAFRLFLDLDNSTSSGYLIAGIGADRLVELRGKDGQVTQSALLAFSGSFPGQWSWTPISPVTAAAGHHALELSVPVTVANVHVEAGDFWGSSDSAAPSAALAPSFVSFRVASANAPLSVPWIQEGPQVAATLVDASSNSATTVYNHQRKVVRAGDTPGTACDATNSDGCWYALFYDQLAEDQSTTAAGTETITKGTKVSGTFPTDIATEDGVTILYREGDATTTLTAIAAFNTGTGTSSIDVVINFQAEAMILWMSGRTGTSDAFGGEEHKRSMGFGTSTTDRRAICSQSDDGASTMAADRTHRTDAILCSIPNAGGAPDGLLDISAIDSDSVTFVPDDAFPASYRVHALFLGGGALTNAATGQFSEPGATGDQNVVVTGSFQPEAVFLMSAMIAADAPANDVDSSLMFGFAAGSGNPTDVVWSGGSDDAALTSETMEYTRTGESVALYVADIPVTPAAASVDGRAEIDAWNTDGFSLNWNEVTAGAREIHYLALDGVSVVAGDFTTSTTLNTDIVESGFGFSPSGALFVSAAKAQDAVDTPRNIEDEWSMGAFASLTEGVQGVRDDDAASSAVVGTILQHDEVYAHTTTGDVVEGLVGLQSIDSGGFTLNQDDADPSASYVGYIAFGGPAEMEVRYDWSGVPAGDAYTLKVKGYRVDEDVRVQVLTPSSTWNTRITISATSNTLHTYVLTASEYNSGSPAIRFLDATSGESSASDLRVDFAVITTGSHWDRIILMRSSDTAGSTWGSQIILASGRTGDSALLLARDSAEPSIAIDSSGYLHIVWVSASSAGNQATLNLVRYTKTNVAYPTQAQLGSGSNWDAVTNVDDTNTGYMPTVSTDSNNRPHIAWSGSRTSGSAHYKNQIGGTWRSTVTLGTSNTAISVDVAPNGDFVSTVSLSVTNSNWWNAAYSNRERITVTTGSASAPTGYSIATTVNHAALVSLGMASSSGDDVRLLYWTGSAWSELDRVLDGGSAWNSASTKLWFKTQAAIGASSSDNNYYLYYGNPTAASAPADANNVFLFFDDFEAGNLNEWTMPNGGLWAVATDQARAGTYSMKYPTETATDRQIIANPALNEGGVYLDAWWRGSSTALNIAQVFRSNSAGSSNYEAVLETTEGWAIAKRITYTWTQLSTNQGTPAANTWTRIGIGIDGTGMRVFKDAVQIVPTSGSYNVGTELSSGNIGFRKWDIPSGDAWWIDDVAARKYVDPEPTTSMAAETEVQYRTCRDPSTSLCDAAGDFKKWDGTAGYDIVASGVEATSFPSLATTYETNGDLWVAYPKDVDASTTAIYARFLDQTSAGWSSPETVDSFTGTSFARPSIGVDKDNNLHAMYVRTNGPQVYYRSRVGGGWGSDATPSTETLTTGTKVAGTFPGDVQWEDSSFVQYREAVSTLQAKAGTFSITTGSNGATVPVTGVGFLPEVVLFWWSGRTEVSDVTDGKNIVRGFGVATSTTDRRAVFTQAQDGSGTSATDSGHHDAAVIGALSTSGSIVGLADVQSLDSDGFTLIIDDQFPDNLRVNYLALGGAALTNAATGVFTENAAPGVQQITSLSFQPDAVLFFSSMVGADPPGTAVDSGMMVGAATGTTPTNAVWAGGANDAAATMQSISYGRVGESIALLDSAVTTTTARAGVTQWLSNGFTLNWAETSGSRRIHYVALKGGAYHIGDLLTATTITTIAETGVGFTPKGALLASHTSSQSSADSPQDSDRWSLGAFTYPLRAAQGTADLDGLTDAQTATSLEQDEIYVSISASDVVDGAMDIQSVDSDGFTAVMDDADSAQRFVWYLAVGDSAKMEVKYDWTGVPSGSAYTLTLRGYRQDENVDVQVLTPPSTWTTRLTISATSTTRYVYTMTSAEYNSGAPSIRFVDANSFEGVLSDLFVDIALVTSGNGRDLVDTPSDHVSLVVRAPNHATYGTTLGGLYWKTTTSETYFYIPEFDAVLLPAFSLLALVLVCRRKYRSKRAAPSGVAGIAETSPADGSSH